MLALLAGGKLLADGTCPLAASRQTEGPYWIDENLNRKDLRSDPADGIPRPGVPLSLDLRVHEINGLKCAEMEGAKVDIWHCDAGGFYSDEQSNRTLGKKFLRGYQIAAKDGGVQFQTIYPGWYRGRTIHIHVRVRRYEGSRLAKDFTAQFFFDDELSDHVLANKPYNPRPAGEVRNKTDNVLGDTHGPALYPAIQTAAQGYRATIEFGVDFTAAAARGPGGPGRRPFGPPPPRP